MSDSERSFGVFKPVGHLVISFPDARMATASELALRGAGVVPGDIRHYTDRQMLEQIDQDVAHASVVAEIGQEMNLVRAHRVLAEQGYHFLVVRVPPDLAPQQMADLARSQGALRAQLYGHFIIEELIEQPDQSTQVAESPDRGLDAGTESGLEAEAGERHRQRVGGDEDATPSGRVS